MVKAFSAESRMHGTKVLPGIKSLSGETVLDPGVDWNPGQLLVSRTLRVHGSGQNAPTRRTNARTRLPNL